MAPVDRAARWRWAAAGFMLAALAAAASPALANDQWNASGPARGAVRSLTIDPSDPTRMYAGLRAAIARSRDGGATWQRIAVPSLNFAAEVVIDPARPRRLFLTGFNGVLRSDDAGDTWTDIAEVGTIGSFVDALTFDGDALYASAGVGLWRSDDGGDAWQDDGAGLQTSFRAGVLLAHPSQTGRLYAGGSESLIEPDLTQPFPGLYRLRDGTWEAASVGLPRRSAVYGLILDRRQPATLYAAVASLEDDGSELGQGVYKSVDGAATWQRTALDQYDLRGLAIDPVDGRRIYGWTFGTLLTTDDGGESWQLRPPPASTFESLVAHPTETGVAYLATADGLFRTADAGVQWEPFAEAIVSSTVDAMIADPLVPRTAYASAGGRLYRTTDGGNRWEERGQGGGVLAFDPALRAIYAEGCCPGVERSDDQGASWAERSDGLPDDGEVSHLVRQAATGVLYVAVAEIDSFDDGGVWRSADDGELWEPASSGLSGQRLTALVAHPTQAGLLYAADESAVFRTEDGGDFWQRLEIDPRSDLARLAVTGADPDLVWLAESRTVSRSDDRGETWRSGRLPESSRALDRVSALAIDPRVPLTGYVGLRYGGVLATDDGGATWAPLAHGYPLGVEVRSLTVDERLPARIYAGTDGAGAQVLVRAARLPCAADCDANGRVVVSEVVTTVGISLGEVLADVCPPADSDDNGSVTIDDLIRAVTAALSGCQR